SLADQGFAVEIAAVWAHGLAEEEQDGEVIIRRHRPKPPEGGPPGRLDRLILWGHRLSGRLLPPLGRLPPLTSRTLRRVFLWPLQMHDWWATLRREVPPADLYHACGYLAVPVALELARRARRQGRRGRVIYDVIDVVLDSNLYMAVPRPLVALYKLKERGWVRQVDAVVTVNQPIADHLERIWHLRERPTVLLNCPPRWAPPAERPDLIRQAIGIPPERWIVLFLGRLVREKGLDEAAEAVLGLEDAALVVIGAGLLHERVSARDRDPRYSGRHFTLPLVHPDALAEWTASADVSFVAMPDNSLNQRLSSPNKFWESITAGTPVVVGRGLSFMRGIVERERLGATAGPTDPADLARAFRAVLEQPPDDLEAMRGRCVTVARERYHWERTVRPYLALVRRLS
ncbi:MAG: glycosyltransferase, partial [Chloroflexi bacterium]|nr:glycosyltransferase [Chloroflexota bacterium]